MSSYTFHSLNLRGAVALSQNLTCRDDLDALAEGESRSGKWWAIEIWTGARLVARIKLGNAPLDAADLRCL